jgi:hypothetical protein
LLWHLITLFHSLICVQLVKATLILKRRSSKFDNQINWVPDSCSIYSHHRYWRHVSLPFYIFFLFLSCLPFLSVFWIQPKVVSVSVLCTCCSSAITHTLHTVHTLHFHSSVKFFSFFIRVLLFQLKYTTMFNFLIGKDARKILKRKDSDAGQKGMFFFLLFFNTLFLVFTLIWIWVFVYVCIWEIFCFLVFFYCLLICEIWFV